MKVSIIIPVYNEQAVIGNCLNSLKSQAFKDFEIIVVDDGSSDDTKKVVENKNVTLLSQNHKGTGPARNLGAKSAKGDILVFVDSDMEFDPSFLAVLTAPIISGKTIGTYSTNEALLNTNQPWAVAWNQYFSGSSDKVVSEKQNGTEKSSYHAVKKLLEKIERIIAPIAHDSITELAGSHSHLPYRAIQKSSFDSVGGFTVGVGYTDDWTLAEKLHTLPLPTNAKYFHRSPATPSEIWRQARWIGKDQLKSGNIVRKIHTLAIYNPLSAFILGIGKAVKLYNPRLLPFTLIYSTGVMVSTLGSFVSKNSAR